MRSAPCTKRLDQREAHDVFDIPTTKRQRGALSGGNTCRRPGAQRPRHRRRARSAWPRPGCRRRTGAQRPRHRRRARSASRRWQPAAAPPGTQARSALGAQRRAPSAERVARGAGQARRRRRVRSAHATGAERVARGGASWHAVAQPAQAAHAADAGRLLPASAALTTNIVVWPQTMSPAPGRRPPIS